MEREISAKHAYLEWSTIDRACLFIHICDSSWLPIVKKLHVGGLRFL